MKLLMTWHRLVGLIISLMLLSGCIVGDGCALSENGKGWNELMGDGERVRLFARWIGTLKKSDIVYVFQCTGRVSIEGLGPPRGIDGMEDSALMYDKVSRPVLLTAQDVSQFTGVFQDMSALDAEATASAERLFRNILVSPDSTYEQALNPGEFVNVQTVRCVKSSRLSPPSSLGACRKAENVPGEGGGSPMGPGDYGPVVAPPCVPGPEQVCEQP